MATIPDVLRSRPAPATLAGGALVLVGFWFLGVHPIFYVILAAGAFGPGLLREFGWLRDQDEFQRRIAHRAAYHAYLAAGIVSFLLLALFRNRPDRSADPEAILTTLLALLWFTWLLSSLLAYWGTRRTASRLLLAFGIVWLIFNVLGHFSSPVELLMQSLLALPFFLAAWLARRLPRVAGGVLLLASGLFVWRFQLYDVLGSTPLAKGRGFVLLLFVGPLLASGIALLRGDSEGSEAD